MAGEDGHSAVELFGEQYPHDLVRPGQPAEGQAPVGARQDFFAEPVRSADHQDRPGDAGFRLPAQSGGKALAVRKLAACVEADDAAAF